MADRSSDPAGGLPNPVRKVRIFNHRRTGRFGFEDEAPPPPPDTLISPTDTQNLVELRLDPPVDALPPIDDLQATQVRPDGYNRPRLDSQALPFADSGYVRPTAPSAIVDGDVMRQSLPPIDAAPAAAAPPPEEAIDHTNSHDLRLMFPHLTEKIALRRPAESLAERQEILDSAVRHLECTGEVFGDFLLTRRFSAGGFGEVWVARDTASDKNVVLKRLQPEHHENKRAFYQFDIEIEIGQRIKHPNLAPILKSGVISGRRYFTMPEITGPSLTRVLLGKAPWPMTTEDILSALEAIGRALGFMHRAGVIHADVKPDNILFASRTRPMLIDLGLARTLNWEETGYRTLKSFREDKSVMGTPEYMAPELIKGDNWEIGPAADVYSLGVVLYEVMTGKAPFVRPAAPAGKAQSGSQLARALQDVMDHVTNTAPRPVLDLNPHAPLPLAALAMQCLNKNPAERPQSADHVSAAIARFLRPAANFTVASKPSTLSRMTRWLRRPNDKT